MPSLSVAHCQWLHFKIPLSHSFHKVWQKTFCSHQKGTDKGANIAISIWPPFYIPFYYFEHSKTREQERKKHGLSLFSFTIVIKVLLHNVCDWRSMQIKPHRALTLILLVLSCTDNKISAWNWHFFLYYCMHHEHIQSSFLDYISHHCQTNRSRKKKLLSFTTLASKAIQWKLEKCPPTNGWVKWVNLF